jgi:phage shock protein A
MAETQSVRLDRIEKKIDKLSDAIITLARVEEKISDLELRRVESHERANRISANIDELDRKVTSLNEKVLVLNRVMWIVVASVIGTIFAQLQGLL